MADKIIECLKESKGFYKSKPPRKIPFFYECVLGAVSVDGLWLDFCIGKTTATTQHIMASSDKDKTVHGFDWFGGLPEEWVAADGEIYKVGTFQVASDPEKIADAVKLIENKYKNIHVVCGLIQESLPPFLDEHPGQCAFIHIDCDLYSTTSAILTLLTPRIVPGTVILFDEFWNFQYYKDGEYRAFVEFIEATGHEYEFVAHVIDKRQVGIKIL